MRRLSCVSWHQTRVAGILDIEDSVGRVHGGLVLCSLADQPLLGGEGDERWGGEVSLLVRNCNRLVGDWNDG